MLAVYDDIWGHFFDEAIYKRNEEMMLSIVAIMQKKRPKAFFY